MENNLFNLSNVDFELNDLEHFNDLVTYKNARIERIVSRGQVTTEDWLVQSHFEFVSVLQGEACVVFDSNDTYVLKAGDSLSIPPGQKHRVTYTSITPECIWLAIHIQ